ncbi:uncharacterized protein LOC135943914 [Cloeon dipterum]|uniref:uncharacterized protein LOC135943914 n=1 Tax=Cloeon dipterum TaxID=197152 RepID=UPI0032208D6E
MTLLTVTSLEGLRCISNFKAGTYWTSGSNEDLNCDSEKKYAWCSTGFALSSALLALNEFWLPTNTTPTALDRCLAVAISSTPRRGVEHRGCDQTLPFICQYNVDCPKLCVKNDSLFDSVGNLMNKAAYGIWYNIGNLTYLLGNKPVTWAGNYQQCCALGMEALNIDNAAEQTGLKRFTIVNIGLTQVKTKK